MRTRTSMVLLRGAGGLLVALQGASASAQSATPEESRSATAPTTTGDIVVTANKRAERLQDVPSSVAVVTGAELARTQTLDIQDLSTRVAGLDLETGVLGTASKIILRGQNSQGDGATVATVIDNFPLSFSGANTDGGYVSTDLDTYDLQRIEVLRGPQGTLYGATAEGGLVKYVTNPPDYTHWSGGLEAGAIGVEHGNVGASGKGYLNIPLLSGAAGARINAYYEDLPGWIDNSILGERRVNDSYKYGGRISLAWDATPDLHIHLLGIGQYQHSSGPNEVNIVSPLSTGLKLVKGLTLDTYIDQPTKNTIWLGGLDLDYNLHGAHLQSITSYGRVEQSLVADNPPYFGLFAPNAVVRTRQTNALKKFSQELRLASEQRAGAAFDWQLGAFYTHEAVQFDQFYDGLSYPQLATLAAPLGALYSGVTPTTYNEYAAYADGTIHFTRRFDLQLGGRIFHNDETMRAVESGLLIGATQPIVFDPVRQRETSYTYAAAARYRINPDVMVYARVASGYRPGGPEFPFPNTPAGIPDTFESDSTVNYEAGLKGSFFDRRLSIDLSAFYIDWTRIQIVQQFFVTINGQQQSHTQTGNAGKAASKGIELNVSVTPAKGLSLGLVGAYTDAHLTEDAPALGAAAGEQLPDVPFISGSLNIDYEHQLAGALRGFVGGNWAYKGHRYTIFSTLASISHQELASYSNISLHAGVRKGGYTFEVYGKNITDVRGVSGYLPLAGINGGDLANLIRPRVIGMRLAADF